MLKLQELRKITASRITEPIVRLLAKTSVTPTALTWIGFFISVGAAVLIVFNNLFAAGFVVLFSGFFDILDGALARLTNRVTRFGGVIDSTLDRVSDSLILLAILALFIFTEGSPVSSFLSKEWTIFLIALALPSSLLVSYVRAKAEIIRLECQSGIGTRAERVVILALGLILSQFDSALIIALLMIVLFSLISVVQRLLFVWQHTKKM